MNISKVLYDSLVKKQHGLIKKKVEYMNFLLKNKILKAFVPHYSLNLVNST